MKKMLIPLVLLLCVLITACSSGNPDKTTGNSDVSGTSNDQENISEGVTLVPVNNSLVDYVPSATSSQDLTEEDCEMLALDIYDEVLGIVKEFYGSPEFLKVQPGSYPAGEIPYTEVYVNPNPRDEYPIVFENNADSIRAIVDDYFTDSLIDLAFSLEYPCPIYEEDGVLYRTSYETNVGEKGCDISAGRILSRENGIVRYGFPIYFIDNETYEPDTEFWTLGYMDFMFEDEKWKLNDFRLSNVFYSVTEFPGGDAPIRMDDFFETEDVLQSDNISAALENGKSVSCVVDGKTVTAELNITASKVRKIERAGGNVFVSFLGAFEETETLVIAEESGEIVSRFVSNGYCTDESGNWYYVVIDREEQKGDIFDKDGTAIRNFVAVKQDSAEYRAFLQIAPIEELTFDGETFTVSYDITAY